MSRRRRSRPLARPRLGLALVAAAVAVGVLPTCGALGRMLQQGLLYLVGSAGVAMLVADFAIAGLLLAFPGLLEAALAFRPGFRGKKSLSSSTRQRRGFVPSTIASPAMGPDPERPNLRQSRQQGGRARVAALDNITPRSSTVALREQVKIDRLRTGLASLGFRKQEVDAVIGDLDHAAPLEVLMKEAIKTMHRPGAAS